MGNEGDGAHFPVLGIDWASPFPPLPPRVTDASIRELFAEIERRTGCEMGPVIDCVLVEGGFVEERELDERPGAGGSDWPHGESEE